MHLFADSIWTKALALKGKIINPRGPNLYVRLTGRKSGFLDWLLDMCGINTTTVWEVYDNK